MGSTAAKRVTAVAYIRVSTDNQENGPEAQLNSIKAWSSLNDIEIVGIFQDIGVSGATEVSERDGLIRAISRVSERGSEYLVIKTRDRLARDVFAAAYIERKLLNMGARVVTTSEDPSTPVSAEQKLMHGIIDSFAQYERAVISRRTKDALAVVRARGLKRVGGARYEDSEKGREKIHKIISLHREGLSSTEIVRWLRVNAVCTMHGGRHWEGKTVRGLIERHKNDPRFTRNLLLEKSSKDIVIV